MLSRPRQPIHESTDVYRRGLRALVDFALPSTCVGCDQLPASFPLLLCPRCYSRVRWRPRRCCSTCGQLPTVHRGSANDRSSYPAAPRCRSCQDRRFGFDRLLTVWEYAPPIDGLLQALKFGRLEQLGPKIAEAAADRLRFPLRGCETLIPVPLPRLRHWRRGFNQAETIARPLGQRLQIPVHSLLRRRHRRPQAELERSARRRNLLGSFYVPRRYRRQLDGRTVALLDDVVTSGATLEHASRTLKRNGAAAVVAIAVARTPAPRE